VRAILAPDGKKTHIDKPTSFQASARVKRELSASVHAMTCEKKGMKNTPFKFRVRKTCKTVN